MDCGALPLLADPAAHGAVGFCGAVWGGVLPGAGVAFGGVGADSGVPGFAPGLFWGGFPVEFVGGMFAGAVTQGPFPGAGTGAGVVGSELPGVPGAGVVWGVLGVVCVWGVASVPSPAALVVMGVGGPIVFVGGVMFGFAGAVPGVGAGATGTVALGAAACAGVVVVADGAVGAGAGVVARVRCAATQLVQLKIAISRMNCLVIGFLLGNIAAVLTGMPFL